MTSAATTATPVPARLHDEDVPLWRLHLLRATYLLLIIGLGAMIVPVVLSHEPSARGVIPSLLCGVWILAFIGLVQPLRMVPLLMFELAWKAVWLFAFGLPQWLSGQQPPTFADDMFNIALGVILMPIVIPWGYVRRRYVKAWERWS